MFIPLYNLDYDYTQTSIQFDTEYIVPVTNSVIDTREDLDTYILNKDLKKLKKFHLPDVITSINISDDEVKSEIKNDNEFNNEYDFSIVVMPRQKITMKAKISSVKHIKKPIFLN